MPRSREIRALALGLASISLISLLSACEGSPPDIYARKPPARSDTLAAAREDGIERRALSRYQQVFTTRVVGSEVRRERVGFVEHRHKLFDDEGQYLVYSMSDADRAVGFYMPNGATFRLHDESRGRGAIDRVELGRYTPTISIKMLLGIDPEVGIELRELPRSVD